MKSMLPGEVATVRRLVAALKDRPGPCIEVLHAVQAALGYVPADAVPIIAEALNLSRAEVHGVLVAHAKRRLGVDFHETTGGI
jgi:formate dehydrogenase subunit gamma